MCQIVVYVDDLSSASCSETGEQRGERKRKRKERVHWLPSADVYLLTTMLSKGPWKYSVRSPEHKVCLLSMTVKLVLVNIIN